MRKITKAQKAQARREWAASSKRLRDMVDRGWRAFFTRRGIDPDSLARNPMDESFSNPRRRDIGFNRG